MATTLDPRDRAIVNYDEPPIKPPPVMAVGPLAWMRDNLFHSTFDTILTIISVILLGGVIIGVLQWAIGAANWLVITNNLRLFMVGTFPTDALWRPAWAARLCAFVIGFTLFAYARASRTLVLILVAAVALLLVVPIVVDATTPPLNAYLAAGSTTVVSGTVSEMPHDQLAFIARAGETVTIRLANTPGDASLADTAGFTDRAGNALVNAAANRLETVQEQADLQNRLDRGLLTDAQREDLSSQLNNMQVPDPVTETYQLNQSPVEVAILDGDTLETLASATLTANSAPLSLTLPGDGWYVLQKSTDGTALLATTGIYPLNDSNFTRQLSSGGSATVTQYTRVTDGLTTEAARPQANGDNIPSMAVTDNQYQGMRPFSDFLRLFVAPFFRLLGSPMLQLFVFGAVGYLGSSGLARAFPSVLGERGDLRKRVRGMTTWLWILWLIALFLLCYGIQGLDAVGVGILISRFIWVGWMYFVGMNLDRAWGRPLLALVTLLGIVQAVIGEGLLDKLRAGDSGELVVGVVVTAIWLFAGFYAARKGRGQESHWDNSRRLRALVVMAALWLIVFLAPPLILNAAGATQNVLPLSDTRRWGGFLLTALLTIVALLASFPLGVLLALGRRSSLPVVHWTCIVYIELVRGVPLIAVLFMAQLLVPLVNPSLANVDNVFRAMVGMTLFSAAYLAENVRGGLQAVPHGQEEAAKALGLSGYQVTLLILLPQALRIVIPALVGQAIALFKDTSLVALVGLVDLTGTAQSVVAQSEYIGLQKEVYFFIAIIYFVFSYAMAWISRRIEASGSGAARRV